MKPGWVTVRLGELVDFYSGGTPSKAERRYWDGDVPWFSAKDLKRDRLSDSIDHINKVVFDETNLRQLPAGTITIVVRGMILAHTVPISILDVPAAINQDLKALLLKRQGQIDIAYLAGALRAQHARILSDVSRAAHGTTKLESRVLENIEISLPPLDEQRRIAAVLDHVDAIRAKRSRTFAEFPRLTQAQLDQALSSGAQATPLDVLVEEFRYGTSEKSGHSGLPTLRIPNVVGGALDLAEIKTVPVDAKTRDRLVLRDGDLLFVRTNGNADYVGRSTVYSRDAMSSGGFDPDTTIFASYLIRARLAEGRADPAFVQAFLSSPEGRRRLRTNAKTSAGQYNINIAGLGSTVLDLPSLAKQREFSIGAARMDSLRTVAKRHLADLDALFASLQSRAFAGELDVSKVAVPS